MHRRRSISLSLSLSLLFALACNDSETFSGEVDTALLHRAGGDVMLADGGRVPYEITSERYRQWEAARRGLREAKIGLTMSIDPLRVSERDLQRAVDYFQRNDRGRRIIESTGLSVRDYVLTTIALEQQMAVASGRWGERAAPRAPARPAAPPEAIAAELARDTMSQPRVDTVPVVDTVVIPVDPIPQPQPTPTPPPPPPDTTMAADSTS